MRINWKIWGQDTYFIWQSSSSHLYWSTDEEAILKQMLEEKKNIQETMKALPRFSPDSLRTKCLRDYDQSPLHSRDFRLDSCLSVADFETLARYNIPIEEIARLRGMDILAKDKKGNAYYRRPYDGKVKAKDGAFFMGILA